MNHCLKEWACYAREIERQTLQIHKLCMTGLRRDTPIYPKNKKNVNCISARCESKALLYHNS